MWKSSTSLWEFPSVKNQSFTSAVFIYANQSSNKQAGENFSSRSSGLIKPKLFFSLDTFHNAKIAKPLKKENIYIYDPLPVDNYISHMQKKVRNREEGISSDIEKDVF